MDVHIEMLLSEWIQKILNEIEKLEIPSTNQDIFVCLIAQFEYEKLLTLLTHYEDSTLQVNFVNVKLFCNEMSDYWYRIKKTSLSYLNLPDLPINQAFMILANKLMPVVNISKEHLLIPTPEECVSSEFSRENQRYFTHYILSTMKHFNEFVMYMMSHMHAKKWGEFLAGIHEDELSRLILNNDSFIIVLQRSSLYQADVTYNKAVLLCLTEMYWRMSSKEEENVSFAQATKKIAGFFGSFGKLIEEVGETSKKWVGGFTKEEKVEAVKALRNFLTSSREFSEIDEFIATLNSACANALLQGRTYLIVEQIRLLATLRYVPK